MKSLYPQGVLFGYSRKKKKQGGLVWLGTWNFQGYWRNFTGKFQGSIEKEVEFPGLLQKNSCGISMGIGFWTWNFEGMSHNFAEFPGVKVCFLWNFQG